MAAFAVGDIVRMKGTGRQATIESINPNPYFASDDETWAEASSSTGYNDIDILSPDDIELVLSAADAATRSIATSSEVASVVADALHTALIDKFAVRETQVTENEVVVLAETGDGLNFRFTITVSDAERVLL